MMWPIFGGERAISASFLASQSLLERMTFRLCLWGSSRRILRLQRLSGLRCRLGGRDHSFILEVQILGLVCRMCGRTHTRRSTCGKSEAAACRVQLLQICMLLPLLRETKQSKSFGFQVSGIDEEFQALTCRLCILGCQRRTFCLWRLSVLSMTETGGVLHAAEILFWRLGCVGVLHCKLFPPFQGLTSSFPSSLSRLSLPGSGLF